MAIEVIILLSVIQGFTEFLPISSSAHLVFLSDLFGGFTSQRNFDVSLHFGSLLAVIIYLRIEILKIILISLFSKVFDLFYNEKQYLVYHFLMKQLFFLSKADSMSALFNIDNIYFFLKADNIFLFLSNQSVSF